MHTACSQVRPKPSKIPFWSAQSDCVVTKQSPQTQQAQDGGFYAFHAQTGEQLFHYDAGRTLRSSPLTYEVNGTQYVAVIATNTVLAFALP